MHLNSLKLCKHYQLLPLIFFLATSLAMIGTELWHRYWMLSLGHNKRNAGQTQWKQRLKISHDSPFKGSVSRGLSWVLLYINQKLFSRPIIALHNILTFLKGQFTINKKQTGAALYYDMDSSRQYWKRRKIWFAQY